MRDHKLAAECRGATGKPVRPIGHQDQFIAQPAFLACSDLARADQGYHHAITPSRQLSRSFPIRPGWSFSTRAVVILSGRGILLLELESLYE
jgi:hypothetical protein